MQNRLVNSSSTHSIFQHSPPGFRAPRLDFYSHALEVALFHQQFIIRQCGALRVPREEHGRRGNRQPSGGAGKPGRGRAAVGRREGPRGESGEHRLKTKANGPCHEGVVLPPLPTTKFNFNFKSGECLMFDAQIDVCVIEAVATPAPMHTR
eukprot:scaffold28804_cov114-Isochrysis_galbana.AAC.3